MEEKLVRTSSMFSHVLNFYDMLLLTTFVLSVLLVIPLLLKRDRQLSDLLLSAFILCQGSISCFTVLFHSEVIGPQTISLLYPFHKLPIIFLTSIQGFLLLWYCQIMMGEKITIKSKVHVIGLIIFSSVTVIDVWLTFYSHNMYPKYTSGMSAIHVMTLILAFMTLTKLHKFDRNIRLRFSNIDNIRLQWLTIYSVGFAAVWMLFVVVDIASAIGWTEVAVDVSTFANLPPLLFLSGMVVHGQTQPLNQELFDLQQAENDANLFDDEHYVANTANRNKLENLMLRVKIYQDPELRLDGLADSMGLSPRSVSTLLNGYYQKNFYDFINHYRVLDAQQQLRCIENQDKSIQRIFEDAGFNSKTTFNTIFKKLTGKTPSEYRNLKAQQHPKVS